MSRLALLLLTLTTAAAQPAPDGHVGFESESPLAGWAVGDRGKQPLTVARDRAHEGTRSAYSGPPGAMRVMTRSFGLPLAGRLEVWFYDDMAPRKHQIAAAKGLGDELLGIVCSGGKVYQTRIGREYTDTTVERSEGWHRFAWSCDGARTTASINGVEVRVNEDLGRLVSISLGSFWDDSTGWWDDLRWWRESPASSGAYIEAELAGRQLNGEVQAVERAGARGLAVTRWDDSGHALEWSYRPAAAGPATLVLKVATDANQALRTVTVGESRATLAVDGTGGWDRWAYVGVPVELDPDRPLIRMVNAEGPLNLDWLAIAPAGVDPDAYGATLDATMRAKDWVAAAQRRLNAQGVAAEPAAAWPDQVAEPQTADALMATAAAARAAVVQPARAAAARLVPPAVRAVRPLGPETELSREVYGRLLRYVRLTHPRMADWPGWPGARYHKRDGHVEWDVRQNATVALGYATLLLGPYDASVAGVPREILERDLLGLLRYLAVTHTANLLPTGDGEPWGDHWQSAFWAAIAGQAAWMHWGRLAPETQALVARMIVHEADRFNERPPDSGVVADTKAEENAWNSEILALAASMLPDHPHSKLWRERAIVYMVNSFVRESDRHSDRVVDGKPLRERVTAVTLHEDYTLENHHRVHPDYLATGSLLLRNALLYQMAGLPVPESASFNVPETFDILKRLTATTGGFFYVNGQDWWPHRHDVPFFLAGFMAALHGDAEAARAERLGLDFLAKMHARFDDGRAWDPREYNYANAEEEMIARYAELYLLHRLFGDGPAPVSREAFVASQSGTHVYETGGFVTHRTAAKLASFAWVNGAMGLVYPGDDTWFTSPNLRGLVGHVAAAGLRDTLEVEAHRVRPLDDGGFAAAARLARAEGAVEQAVAMVSLPGAPVLYLERLRARREVTLEHIATGLVAVLNEDAPGITPGTRRVHHAGGVYTARGAADGHDDETVRLDTPWANVDGKLGIVSTAGGMALVDRHRYRQSRLEFDIAARHRDRRGGVPTGADLGGVAVALIPGQAPAETAATDLALSQPAPGVVAARLGDTLVVANLGDAPVETAAFGRAVRLEALAVAVWAGE